MDWPVVVQFRKIAEWLVLRLLWSVVTEVRVRVRVRRRRGRGRRRGSRIGDAGDDLSRNAGRQRLVRVVRKRLLALWRLLLLLLERLLSLLLLLVVLVMVVELALLQRR